MDVLTELKVPHWHNNLDCFITVSTPVINDLLRLTNKIILALEIYHIC